MDAIGFLELNSISKGIEAADAMLKAAQVRLVTAKPSCPGKYNILVTGNVGAVQSSMKAGEAAGGSHVVDRLLIPRIHQQVVEAVNMSAIPERMQAIGVLEYFSVAASIIGADAAVKAAEIALIEIRLGTGIGGKSFVVMTGDVAAVKVAVKSGELAAEENGMLVSSTVIASPHKELYRCLY
jgi:microcompartment protein CcmL/EutN